MAEIEKTWTSTIFNENRKADILVKFLHEDGWHGYTNNVFGLLKTEEEVEYIIDADTGEILFSQE